jgi:hypothetical protein
VREAVLKPFTGDLDEIVKRRALRLGVTFNRTFYFVDRACNAASRTSTASSWSDGSTNASRPHRQQDPRDLRAAAARDAAFGAHRRQSRPRCGAAPGDAELKKFVDFSDPTRSNVNQIVVTGPGASPP